MTNKRTEGIFADDLAVLKDCKHFGWTYRRAPGWKQKRLEREGYLQKVYRFDATAGREIPVYILTQKGIDAFEEKLREIQEMKHKPERS